MTMKMMSNPARFSSLLCGLALAFTATSVLADDAENVKQLAAKLAPARAHLSLIHI